MSEDVKEPVTTTTGVPHETEKAEGTNTENSQKKRMTKKKWAIIGAIVLVVAIVIAVASIPSKFERVENECLHIAGRMSSMEKIIFPSIQILSTIWKLT